MSKLDKNAKEFKSTKDFKPAKYGTPEIPKNEIRIRSDRSLSGYLKYAYQCLEKDGMDSIVIKGVGQAMNRIVDLAELIKSKIVGLYSNTEMLTQVDKFDPSRTILSLKITLSKTELDKDSPGFQEPIDESLVTPYVEDVEEYKHFNEDEEEYAPPPKSYGYKPRGYGRPYRSRGEGRGGYRSRGGRRGGRRARYYHD